MVHFRRLAWLAASAASVFTSMVFAQSTAPASTPGVNAPVLYFVPIGAASPDRIATLAQYYRDTLHITVEILQAFTPPLDLWDGTKVAWRAPDLTDAVAEREETRIRSQHAAVIGIAADDIAEPKDPYTFGWRNIPLHTGVVSYAHLAARTDGADGTKTVETRLRRMVTRYVGLMLFDFFDSRDKQSPMFNGIRSTADLDGISDDLLAAGFVMRRSLTNVDRPVSIVTGAYTRRDQDFRVNDNPPIVFERVYRSNDDRDRHQPFGIGATHSYGSSLVGDAERFSYLDLILETGTRIHYRRTSPGTSWADGIFVHDTSFSEYNHSRISWQDGSWLLEMADGRSFRHPDCDPHTKLPCTVSGYHDKEGRELRMTFDEEHRLAQIETPSHKKLSIKYDMANRVAGLNDLDGHRRTYQYDDRGRLIFTQAAGEAMSYGYDESNRMIMASTPGWVERMVYDQNGRTTHYERHGEPYVDRAGHTFERTSHIDYSYELANPTGVYPKAVTITDGAATPSITYNTSGYVVREEFGAGTPFEQTTTYDRDPETNHARALSVACGDPEHAAIVQERVTIGQNESTIAGRARLECDRLALAAR